MAKNAIQATENVNSVYVPDPETANNVQLWFRRFRFANFVVKDVPRSGMSIVENVDKVMEIVVSHRHVSTVLIAKDININTVIPNVGAGKSKGYLIDLLWFYEKYFECYVFYRARRIASGKIDRIFITFTVLHLEICQYTDGSNPSKDLLIVIRTGDV
nr:uncharacterized protein LOC121123574 [Lepeophtheirus salmonis]